jgi:hypothetical protein
MTCWGKGAEKNRSRYCEKTGVRKNFNQGLIDPDRFFNHDHDRDEFFSIKV